MQKDLIIILPIIILSILIILHSFLLIYSIIKLSKVFKNKYIDIFKIIQYSWMIWIALFYILYFFGMLFFPSRKFIGLLHMFYHPMIVIFIFTNQIQWMTIIIHLNKFVNVFQKGSYYLAKKKIQRKEKTWVYIMVTVAIALLLFYMAEYVIHIAMSWNYKIPFSSFNNEDKTVWKISMVLYSVQYPLFCVFHLLFILNEIILKVKLKKSLDIIRPYFLNEAHGTFGILQTWNISLLSIWMLYYLSILLQNENYWDLIKIIGDSGSLNKTIFGIQVAIDACIVFSYWIINTANISFPEYWFYLIKRLNKLDQFNHWSIFIYTVWNMDDKFSMLRTSDSEFLSDSLMIREVPETIKDKESKSYSIDPNDY